LSKGGGGGEANCGEDIDEAITDSQVRFSLKQPML
jgi:hypothetical protein